MTSDCRPAAGRADVLACEACGAVQKWSDPAWQALCAEIYRGYEVHRQGGRDQSVFLPDADLGLPRARLLAERLAAAAALPETGRLAEIGSGNGNFLAAFGAVRPGWRCIGTELNDRHRATIEALPNVDRLHVGDMSALDGPFDAVVLIHALEHLEQPVDFLRSLRPLLAPGGVVFVQVPNLARNPFDLAIVDHRVHFTPETLARCAAAAGFSDIAVDTAWVAKEISLLLRLDDVRSPAPQAESGDTGRTAPAWLARAAAAFAAAAADGPVAALGTSIAATWTAGLLGDRLACFVDEDADRVNRRFLGRPVVAPDALAPGAVLLLPFPPVQIPSIRARLEARRRDLVLVDPEPAP